LVTSAVVSSSVSATRRDRNTARTCGQRRCAVINSANSSQHQTMRCASSSAAGTCGMSFQKTGEMPQRK
jgi:hypothetical protein